jgi:hypothetical protein
LGALLWASGLFPWILALNIGRKLLLWAFWCGKLLEGKRIIEEKNAKGKRIVEGKMLKRD